MRWLARQRAIDGDLGADPLAAEPRAEERPVALPSPFGVDSDAWARSERFRSS